MKSQREIMGVVNAFAKQLQSALGDNLNAVILFGSYARGDYEDGSDVDVMVLVDVPQEQILLLRDKIHDLSFELGWENQLLISTVIESSEIFYKYKDASGFFRNVLDEGVRISA